MSKQLNDYEVANIAIGLGITEELEALNAAKVAFMNAQTDLAMAVANQLGVAITGPADDLFDGVYVGFCPLYEDQPMPKEIAEYDPDGNWEFVPELIYIRE